MKVNVEAIARICHQVNKAYCESIGDNSQKDWTDAEEWQRQSAVKGVIFRLANPKADEGDQHNAWAAEKTAEGWVYGEVKDAEKKTHPCLVAYEELPVEQRLKDYLFIGVVEAYRFADVNINKEV